MADRAYYSEKDRLDHWYEHGEHLPKAVVARIERAYLGRFFGMGVYDADSYYLRGHVDVDWTTGGNAGRYRYVPQGSIWLEVKEVADTAPSVVHECTECMLMCDKGLSYSDAHDFANLFEWPFRRALAKGVFDGPIGSILGAAGYFMELPAVAATFQKVMQSVDKDNAHSAWGEAQRKQATAYLLAHVAGES